MMNGQNVNNLRQKIPPTLREEVTKEIERTARHQDCRRIK